jgi:predicted phosphodiesterase
MARVLVIGDLHCPADKDEYYDFCKSVQKKYKTDVSVFIGDIVDMESISFHDKNPELPEALEEYKQAKKRVKKWYNGYRKAKSVIGNHDLRAHRKAFKSGIPSFYLLNFNDLYDTDDWTWDHSFIIDGVLYTHGDGWGSQYPAFNAAKAGLQSTVSGHTHSKASINWVRGPNNNYIFGMNVGSGVDQSHPALNYSKPHKDKAIHSCGVVIDGKQAYLEIMR